MSDTQPSLVPYSLDPKQAAAYLGISSETLKTWRTLGKGPIYVKLGASGSTGRVVYRVADLQAFIDGHVMTADVA